MIAPLVSLAASLAPTVFQGILGTKQNQQAEQVAPGARPVYEPPASAKRALDLQRMQAAGNMPGYDQSRESIEAAGANAVLMGAKFGNPNITQAYRGVTSALKDLGVENAGFKERQMNNLIGAYDRFAGYEEKAFDINKMQPYEYALQQAQALKDANNQNIYGALGDASAGIVDTMRVIDYGKEKPVGTQAMGGEGQVVRRSSGDESGLPITTANPNVVSDPTMDAKLKMVISNPKMMGALYNLFQNLNMPNR